MAGFTPTQPPTAVRHPAMGITSRVDIGVAILSIWPKAEK